MESNKENITINIHGGNNQILPTATHAVQNFYGMQEDELAESTGSDYTENEEDKQQSEHAYDEASVLSIYINKVERCQYYTHKLSLCEAAKDIATVAMEMLCDDDVRVDNVEVVKKKFIEKLIPLCQKIDSGITVNNLRHHINNALEKLPRRR